jgi:very-long-chain (3R)-3-hydroxyacyl-CoA dehydratase
MSKIGVKEVYLLAYNAACAMAWALVLRLAIQTLMDDVPKYGVKDALANVYATKDLAMLLTWAQSAAILEIIHSAIGVVRSPVMVTFMQVSSRIVALFALVNSPDAQGKSHESIDVCAYTS